MAEPLLSSKGYTVLHTQSSCVPVQISDPAGSREARELSHIFPSFTFRRVSPLATRSNSMTLSPPQPPPPSSPRHAAIQELRRGTQLAELLRQQVELIPEPDRRHAAVVNVGEISVAMESSLSILQSEMEHHPFSEAAMAAPTACYSDGGTSGERNGAPVARTRRVRHRRGSAGAELPIKQILTEAPENDRFHWRKYGEKNILDAEYPRLYYKCGYSDDHKCPAKKYVQQQSNSYPPLFMVTLINEHTCDTLFRDEPSSSNSAPQVLDFTKASSPSPPLMAAAATVLKKDEEDSIPAVSMHRYSHSYDGY